MEPDRVARRDGEPAPPLGILVGGFAGDGTDDDRSTTLPYLRRSSSSAKLGVPGKPVRGFEPIPSGDGSRFFYLRDTGAALRMRELWTAVSDGTNPRKVGTIGPLPDVWTYDVSPADNKIAYVRLNASRRELWAAQLK
jgi:hypothetical protein